MNEIVAYTKNVTNKLPTDLRGWVAIAESSHWLVWPHGQSKKKTSSAAQQQGCTFLEVSLTLKRQLICQVGRVFCQVRRLICQVGTFICQGGQNIVEKRRLILSCVRGLKALLTWS